MEKHPSLEQVVFTWGKYKGHTLASVSRIAPHYLEWIVKTPGMLPEWVEGSKRALSNEDVSQLNLPRAKQSSIPNTPKNQTGDIKVDLANTKTAYIIMPYNKVLLEQFKYEIDGRKWNAEEKHWEFPIVHLPKLVKLFPNAVLSPKAQKACEKLQERREDLDELRELEDNDEFAKKFFNLVPIGVVVGWDELKTNPMIQKYIKK